MERPFRFSSSDVEPTAVRFGARAGRGLVKDSAEGKRNSALDLIFYAHCDRDTEGHRDPVDLVEVACPQAIELHAQLFAPLRVLVAVRFPLRRDDDGKAQAS